MPPEVESRSEFMQQQKSAARTLQGEGHLAQSRTLWQTVLTLDASDVEASRALDELDIAIAERVDESWRNGVAAYKQGDYRKGDTWMLRLLAVQPGHEDALARLRKSYSLRAQAQQRTKSNEENTLAVARQRAAPGGVYEQLKRYYSKGEYEQALAVGASMSGQAEPAIANLIRQSHIALADRAERSGTLEPALAHVQSAIASYPQADDPLLSRAVELRDQLSVGAYKRGLKLMQTDLDGAIEALDKAVFYNPYNDTARRKLLQAQTLQKNLHRIQGGG